MTKASSESSSDRFAREVFETSQTLNRALLTLSAGGIGLSLAFIESLLFPDAPMLVWGLLFGSWVAFGTTLGLALLSLFNRERAINSLWLVHEIAIGTAKYPETEDSEIRTIFKQALADQDKFEKRTKGLGLAALLAFLIGLALMCALGIGAVVTQRGATTPSEEANVIDDANIHPRIDPGISGWGKKTPSQLGSPPAPSDPTVAPSTDSLGRAAP